MIRWSEETAFGVTGPVLSETDLVPMVGEAERLFAEDGRRPAGVRGVLARSPIMARAAASAEIRRLVEPILGAGAVPVRTILFDKSPDANWDVPWHQDTTIAVVEQIETEGYGPWSVKLGTPHVRPPAAVLESMVTVRIHLDACGADNGALLVAPGTHRGGVTPGPFDIGALERSKVACIAEAGAAVLMRPLIMHASRKAANPTHRRVLHLEFASGPLAAPLRWVML